MADTCFCGRVAPCRLCLPLDPSGEKSGHPRPHETFRYVRPDEVAECFEGVEDDLYTALWAAMKGAPRIRYTDDGPITPDFPLADVWALFSIEQQTRLNEIAAAEEEEFA